MNVFSVDNTFYRIMTKVCYICILSLLWLFCSIPIVTIGASTAAIHTVMLKIVRDEEGYIIRSYFKAFIVNMKQATVIWLIVLSVLVILCGDIYFFGRMENLAGTIGSGIVLALIIIFGLTLTLIFQYQVWFKTPVKITLMNSIQSALGLLPYSFALLLFWIAMIYAIYVSVPLMIFFVFFGMGIFSFVSALVWRNVFDKMEEKINE